MKLEIHLDNGIETITNLSIANAIIDTCDNMTHFRLNPTVIARAMLLEIDARLQAKYEMEQQQCSYGERREG